MQATLIKLISWWDMNQFLHAPSHTAYCPLLLSWALCLDTIVTQLCPAQRYLQPNLFKTSSAAWLFRISVMISCVTCIPGVPYLAGYNLQPASLSLLTARKKCWTSAMYKFSHRAFSSMLLHQCSWWSQCLLTACTARYLLAAGWGVLLPKNYYCLDDIHEADWCRYRTIQNTSDKPDEAGDDGAGQGCVSAATDCVAAAAAACFGLLAGEDGTRDFLLCPAASLEYLRYYVMHQYINTYICRYYVLHQYNDMFIHYEVYRQVSRNSPVLLQIHMHLCIPHQ